jgi:hypothetical protein
MMVGLPGRETTSRGLVRFGRAGAHPSTVLGVAPFVPKKNRHSTRHSSPASRSSRTAPPTDHARPPRRRMRKPVCAMGVGQYRLAQGRAEAGEAVLRAVPTGFLRRVAACAAVFPWNGRAVARQRVQLMAKNSRHVAWSPSFPEGRTSPSRCSLSPDPSPSDVHGRVRPSVVFAVVLCQLSTT